MGLIKSFNTYIQTKLNPAQRYIAAQDPYSAPQNIIDFETAYREIDVVHRSIEIIINAAVSVPLKVEGGAQKRIDRLLNIQPNPFEDRIRLFRRAILDFYLDGNAFFYYDGKDIYVLPANDVEIVSDQKTFVSHYNYMINSNSTDSGTFFKPRASKNDGMRFEAHEIIHIKNDNEASIFRGSSKLKKLESLFELYYSLIRFQRQFFKNNAVPGLVLKTENVLSPKIKERVLEAWRANYGNIFDGARSPAILDGGLAIDKFSNINFHELDFENSVERIQIDIARSLGVPYTLLKSGNNANLGANETLFYTYTVLPVLQMFCSAFALFFSGNIKIIPDKTAIPALQPDNKTQALYYSTLVNTGIITPNEARVGLGLQPLDGQDDLRIPQNIVGSAVNPSLGGRPTDRNTTKPKGDK